MTALLPGFDVAGVRLAVVSSNSEENVRAVLGADAAARIGIYACGASLQGKARLFRKVVRRAGIAPSAVIAIGDEARDLEAAAKAGIAGAAVTWGYGDPASLRARRPAEIFTSVDGMTARLTG